MEKMGATEHEVKDWRSFDSLIKAYRSCRFGKSASLHQISFEAKLGKELLLLHNEIISGKYRPRPAVCFHISRPKPREIFASHFRDRIVHHLIISQIESEWERRFSYSSFACRKGKGTHGALKYLQKLVRSISMGGERKVWALHVDLKSFFVTIDRNVLVELLTEKIQDRDFKQLVESLYLTDLRIGAKKIYTSNNVEIAPGKSWFDQEPDKGLPIGNLTSQFGANVYMNALDQWIQRTLTPRGYIRYMDDLILLGKTEEELIGLDLKIDNWLTHHRKQSLNHAKTKLLPLDKGVLFLGHWCIQTGNPQEPLQLYMKPSSKWEFVKSIRKLEKIGLDTRFKPHQLGPYIEDEKSSKLIASVNSRIGHVKHSKSWLLRKRTLERLLLKTKQFIPEELGESYSPLKINKKFLKVKKS